MVDNPHIILVVEDSEEDFFATKRALNKNGSLANLIFHCADGKDALDYLYHRGEYSDQEKYPLPNVILLDLNLPSVDGREVLKQLKNDKNLCHIPIIVLTTSSDPGDIQHCYDLGANTYVQKPVNLSGYVDALTRVKDYWLKIAVLPKKGE